MNVPALVATQLKLLCLSAFCSLIAKIILSRWFGAAGLFWGNIGGLTFFMLLPSSFIIWRLLTKDERPI
jgi:hypothetical protein